MSDDKKFDEWWETYGAGRVDYDQAYWMWHRRDTEIATLQAQVKALQEYAEAEEKEWNEIQSNDSRYGWDTLKEKRRAALALCGKAGKL